ncbi:MAG TPA: hypothetical protein VK836_08990 [Streptosporangiaceae bacterium]|nr:hypothetical protein [Streptosporangiaceae bacterium]
MPALTTFSHPASVPATAPLAAVTTMCRLTIFTARLMPEVERRRGVLKLAMLHAD